jgi:hypothetical protein
MKFPMISNVKPVNACPISKGCDDDPIRSSRQSVFVNVMSTREDNDFGLNAGIRMRWLFASFKKKIEKEGKTTRESEREY